MRNRQGLPPPDSTRDCRHFALRTPPATWPLTTNIEEHSVARLSVQRRMPPLLTLVLIATGAIQPLHAELASSVSAQRLPTVRPTSFLEA